MRLAWGPIVDPLPADEAARRMQRLVDEAIQRADREAAKAERLVRQGRALRAAKRAS